MVSGTLFVGRFEMKSFVVAAICLLTLSVPLTAKAADLSLDARRMLSYGTTAVEVKICNLPITNDENAQMMTALAKYADAQKDLPQEAFTEAMKAAGAKIGADKDAICNQIATQTVAEMLVDDEAGK
jgi:hypothetical protein